MSILSDVAAHSAPRFEAANAALAPAVPVDEVKASIAHRLRIAEVVVVLTACTLGVVVRFGDEHWRSSWGGPVFWYGLLGAGLALTWLAALRQQKTTDPNVLGSGVTQTRRVLTATAQLLAAVAVLQLVSGLSATRGMLLIAVGGGLLGLLVVHHVARARLHRSWARGRGVARTLVVARPERRAALMNVVSETGVTGYQMVGWLDVDDVSSAASVSQAAHDDVSACVATIRTAAWQAGADVVLLTESGRLGDEGFRDLTWDLHTLGIALVVEPAVNDVAMARMQVDQVNGMTLLHIDEPAYRGAMKGSKRVFDVVTAAAALVVLSPVMIVTMALIKIQDRGPVLYRGTRVGLGGKPFQMLKFRSMVVDAEARLAAVREAAGQGEVAFYKDEDDPRITAVGRLIRRTSIDELPQLFNVLRGDMSIVGPRPMVADEGSEYRGFVQRRVLVRPGITGLWQVSGRSEVSDDDRVRLDLNYVENWSLPGDLAIVGRTVRTVLRQEGAY